MGRALQRATGKLDEEGLALTGRLLAANPDYYSLWNYRRNALEALLAGDLSADDADALFKGELDLTAVALRKNPKSYYAWHHRKWTVVRGRRSLDEELALCSLFLTMDQRNCGCPPRSPSPPPLLSLVKLIACCVRVRACAWQSTAGRTGCGWRTLRV